MQEKEIDVTEATDEQLEEFFRDFFLYIIEERGPATAAKMSRSINEYISDILKAKKNLQ